jgi:hypothetical protein
MTYKNTHKDLMPASRTARTRAVYTAVAALSLGALSACKSSEILNVNDPDVLGVAAYSTPAGADALRYGVIGDFAVAYDGSTDAFTVASGDLADEIYTTDTFDDRLTINARKSVEVNSAMEGLYRNLQQAHIEATTAASVLAKAVPNNKSQRAEMYLIRGFTEIFFGEAWCSGTPFSTQDDAGVHYGKSNSTKDLFTIASASFDSALAFADTSNYIKYGAQIGKGRALLDLGQFAQAAAAVAGVPRSYQYLTYHSTATSRENNGMWSATVNGSTRYSVIDKEGINGLPYLSHDGGTDPRVPWAPSNRDGFDALSHNLPNQLKFGRTSSGIVADGTEAQLIILEARLQGGTQADRDAVFAGLNNLRATNSPAIPPIAGTAPTTQAAAVDQLFTERAYWEWLTGHRLGDMQRLMRQYGRAADSVFPTGALPGGRAGTYGEGTNIVIPLTEKTNPNFTGCLASSGF